MRYYFAAKLSSGVDDIDLNFDDFTQRVNADLVGKVVNIASRCSGFINKRFDGLLSSECSEPILFQQFVVANNEIAKLYESREFGKAMREIMALADKANQYIDEKKPWLIARDEGRDLELRAVCSMGLNLFRLLVAYLQPVIPILAANAANFLNVNSVNWPIAAQPLLSHKINEFVPLMTRIEADKIAAIVAASKENLEKTP